MLDTMFNAVNPPETWKSGIVKCPDCKSKNKVSVPQEARGTEQKCKSCGKRFFFYVEEIKPGEV